MVMCAYKCSTEKTNAGGLRVGDQPGLSRNKTKLKQNKRAKATEMLLITTQYRYPELYTGLALPPGHARASASRDKFKVLTPTEAS